ncbi:zinc-binding dehydrogenase [Algivirga pacifica]|uniref:NADP-dependent oxidoreductase n=1 Tax=Algivirga pacifica TaxID=1162670 RepID=A0ABP9DJ72_9BACT
MKAWVLKEKSTPELMLLEEVDKPTAGPNEVLVEMKATSLNPVDYKITQGAFDMSVPKIVGIDLSGIVVEVGAEVTHLSVGDKVFGIVDIFNNGVFSEYVATNADVLSKIPEGLSFEQAATIPCAGITAWQAVMEKINLQKGQSILISAGGGAVGGFAIQLAKEKGATVFTTASKDFERIKALGADYVIDYKNKDIVEEVNRITEGAGVSHIVDMISGKNAAALSPLLRYNGSLVCITGTPGENPFTPFTKAPAIVEVALGAVFVGGDTQSLRDVAQAGEELAQRMANGKLADNISERLTFAEIPDGLRKVAEGHVSGKIVVNY